VVRDLLKDPFVTSPAIPRRLSRLVLVASFAATLAACDEALRPIGLQLPDGTVRIVAVTPQQLLAQFGVALETPIRVRVLDEQGRPVRSATVKYNVVIGAGAFSADSTLTNDQGFTEVTFRPLSAGMVVVEARVDGGGGTERTQFTIQVLNDPNIGTRFEKVSGDGQSAPVGTVLPAPVVVRVLNADGLPVDSVTVTFAVQQSAGDSAGVSSSRGGPFTGQITIETDASGLATAFVRLGTQAGLHTIRATAVIGEPGAGESQTVSFSATAQASNRVAQLLAVSGLVQTAVIDTLHDREDPDFRGRDPQPLVLQAVDRFGNPVPGVAVTWFVSDGGGRLLNQVTITDASGVTQNEIEEVTVGRNAVVAFVSGAPPLEFEITGELYVPPEEESGSGSESGSGGGG
jgi:hypothetical protein